YVTLARRAARPYSDREIALVETFADQAVIAIENARIFQELQARNRELSEALEQQTAMADVLRILSQAPAALQPVLDGIAGKAARVCGAEDAVIRLREGDTLPVAAHVGPMHGMPAVVAIRRGTPGGRAVLERRTIHIPDLAASSAEEFGSLRADALQRGVRT